MASLISRRPDIQYGSPCIRGTRIPVWTIKSCVKGGWSVETIKWEYPGLTDGQIAAALNYGVRKTPTPMRGSHDLD